MSTTLERIPCGGSTCDAAKLTAGGWKNAAAEVQVVRITVSSAASSWPKSEVLFRPLPPGNRAQARALGHRLPLLLRKWTWKAGRSCSAKPESMVSINGSPGWAAPLRLRSAAGDAGGRRMATAGYPQAGARCSGPSRRSRYAEARGAPLP